MTFFCLPGKSLGVVFGMNAPVVVLGISGARVLKLESLKYSLSLKGI